MAPQTSGAKRPGGKRRLTSVIGTGGRPHHRLDCAGDPDAA